jgi:hypothetical protein
MTSSAPPVYVYIERKKRETRDAGREGRKEGGRVGSELIELGHIRIY